MLIGMIRGSDAIGCSERRSSSTEEDLGLFSAERWGGRIDRAFRTAFGRGGAAVADRLRQYCQPAPGAWSGPPAGKGPARLAGRGAASPPPAGTNGGPGAFPLGAAAPPPPAK